MDQNEIEGEEDSPFGLRYTIEGPVTTPDARNLVIRWVWFIEVGMTTARNAYPIRGNRK